MTLPRDRAAWTKIAEETAIRIAEREAAKRDPVKVYGYVGDANAQDKPISNRCGTGEARPLNGPIGSPVGIIPTLTDAVAGPGAEKMVLVSVWKGEASPDQSVLSVTLGDETLKPVKRKPRSKSNRASIPYHQQLCALLRQYYAVPSPRIEYQFDTTRRWRWDFAWPEEKIALEIDGGLFINGGHNRGAALLKQMEKQNAGTLQGWRILRYTPKQLDQAAADVVRLLCYFHEDKT